MLVVTLHALADFSDVGEDGLLVAFAQALWRGNLEVAILIVTDVELVDEDIEEVRMTCGPLVTCS